MELPLKPVKLNGELYIDPILLKNSGLKIVRPTTLTTIVISQKACNYDVLGYLFNNCKHIRTNSDNTSAIAYRYKMGGIVSHSYNYLLYFWINRNVWLLAVQVRGKDNETADNMSRIQNENTLWRLSPIVFQRILELFYCKPKTDHFISCRNCHTDLFATWHPNRNAMAIDVFSVSCLEYMFYAVPAFSLAGAAIAIVRWQQCSWIIIILWWKTEFWFPRYFSHKYINFDHPNV